MTLAWGLLFKVIPTTDRGTVSGLAVTTRGLGLLVGPLVAGGAIDLLHDQLSSTQGYAAMWPTVAVPVLAVIPFAWRLAAAERTGAPTGKRTRPAA
jgi:MFS family permease